MNNKIIIGIGDSINLNELADLYEQGYRGDVVFDTELRQVVITLVKK